MSDVIQKFYADLVEMLPLDVAKFRARLVTAGLLPGNLKNEVTAKLTVEDQAEHFLDKGIRNDTESFEKLIEVMEKFGDERVNKLARHINSVIHPTRHTTGELLRLSATHITDIDRHNHRSKEIRQLKVAKLHSEIEALQTQLKRQLELMSQLEQDMAALKQGLTSQVSQQQKQVENFTANFDLVQSKAANTKPYSSDLSHVEGVVRTLQHNVDSLSRQVQTMGSKVEENSEQAGTLQTGIDQCTTAINQVNGLLNEVGLKVDILAVQSINGILIWKVNEVEKRIEEARTGKILSLYSPPFFTSLHGYRMCLRLYLDGDGQGKGTHVSLFLVIMKSDYDDRLSWPFKQKVTLYLLNQQDLYNTRAHIAQAFRPTETSTSFQQPKGPFNTASGFPRFAPIAKLYDRCYVQDDCMYFKIKVDMTDLKVPDVNRQIN